MKIADDTFLGNSECEWVNTSMFNIYTRVPLKIDIWICDTFDRNIEVENGFTKYLKESCWQCSD